MNKVKADKAKKDAEAAALAAAEKAVSDLEKTGAEITDENITAAQGLIDKVQDAGKKQALQDRLDKVKADKAKAELVALKKAAKEAIAGLKELTEEEKTVANNAIDQAKDTDAVRAIVDKAKATNETREKEKVAFRRGKERGERGR